MPATVATKLTSLTVDRDMLEMAPAGWRGRVHSVFTSVVNIEPTVGDLWCVSSRAVVPGPRTIVVDVPHLRGCGFTVGQPVVYGDDAVRFDHGIAVRIDSASLWSPTPVTAGPVPRRVETVAAALAATGTTDQSAFGRTVTARIRSALHRIAQAARHSDTRAMTAAASGLIGLGTGLTPAGDDTLTGLLYGMVALDAPPAHVRAVVAAIGFAATNAVSLTALHEAGRGRAHQALIDLLAGICGDRSADDVRRALSRVVAIGHTSGTDQVVGLLTAARLYHGRRGR